MKVFEVICEYCESSSTAVIEERHFVTAEDDSLQSVVNYFTQHCEEYEKDLKGVHAILTVSQRIPAGEGSSHG